MDNSKETSGPQQDTELDAIESHRVTQWLETLTVQTPRDDIKNVDSEERWLRTPPHNNATYHLHDGVSPTSTSFYDNSIFDSAKKLSCPTHRSRYAIDESDTTNLPSEPQSSTDEVNTKDDEQCPTPAPTPTKRIAVIISCLQCTLAHLPCSRTLPACSRCIRNGRANACLLHRRKFLEEIEKDGGLNWSVPILIRLDGEDDQNWERRREIAEELHAQWQDLRDKKNWVLPSWEGVLRWVSYMGKMHPGEGIGEVTFAEVGVGGEVGGVRRRIGMLEAGGFE